MTLKLPWNEQTTTNDCQRKDYGYCGLNPGYLEWSDRVQTTSPIGIHHEI